MPFKPWTQAGDNYDRESFHEFKLNIFVSTSPDPTKTPALISNVWQKKAFS